MFLTVLFLLSVFLPNVGFPSFLPTDNQPIAPLIGLILLLIRRNTKLSSLNLWIFYSFLVLAALCFVSISCSFVPDILRQSISYILIALVILTSSTLNIEQRTLKVFFYSYISLVFIGFIMNILFPSFVNLFVLRQSLDVGHRALSSFYSEPAFLCQTVILLGLFMTFFTSIKRQHIIFPCFLCLLPGAAGQIFLSFFVYSPSLVLPLLTLSSQFKQYISTFYILKRRNVLSLIIISPLVAFFVWFLISRNVLKHFFGIFNTLFLASTSVIVNDSASYKMSGYFFSALFPFSYPFDLCVQKVTFLDPYYPNAMQSWQSISDLFFSRVGFGTYLYSTYGNILVDFTFIGLIFTLFLFFFVFQRIYRFKAFSPLLRFSCFLFVIISLFSVSGIAYWPSWFILGYIFNKNCRLFGFYS